ncbi:MAG: UvrD-helicase domain-containing protein, partial [Acidimicrobiales bacterium]
MTDAPFAVDDELPGRCLAIEASAGTGKTYALADLATRFLAESDISASELLIVTFTRAATNELRARVRERLIEVADRLEPQHPEAGDDKVVRHLASGDVARHRARLRMAIADFDAATITTIHGFAAQVRNALGMAGGVDPDARLIEEADDLRRQTCVDVLAAAAMGECPPDDLPTLGALIDATAQAAGRPDLVLEPWSEDQGASRAQVVLRNLVVESVARMRERRRMSGSLSFDSVLTDLCEALTGPHSMAAVQTLRSRFKVALIDEFQDTDPIQWRIFERLFGEGAGDSSLVLVGDPKQAIYGFRGGDIETYICAVGDNPYIERRSMRSNWRSDAAMLTALDALFDGVTFGDQSIGFVPVTAARDSQDRHICTADGPMPALSVRLAVGGGIDRTKRGKEVSVEDAAAAIDKDLVARVRDLLDNARLPAPTEDGESHKVRPDDIAVLVTTNDQCSAVQMALTSQGVPAVVANAGNVLGSPAADQMRWLLHAMARPSDPRRARTYALSWFGGWSAEKVAGASDADLSDIQELLGDWSERLATHPVADVLARVWSASGVVATVLSSPGMGTAVPRGAPLPPGPSSAAKSTRAKAVRALPCPFA